MKISARDQLWIHGCTCLEDFRDAVNALEVKQGLTAKDRRAIRNCKSLEDLRDAVNDVEVLRTHDALAAHTAIKFPHFGGRHPCDLSEIISWDETRVLYKRVLYKSAVALWNILSRRAFFAAEREDAAYYSEKEDSK